jgi:hypothetical protein
MAGDYPGQTTMNSRARRPVLFRVTLIGMTVVVIAVCMVLAGGLGSVRWTQRVTLAGVPLHIPVVPVLKLATTDLGGRILDGRRVDSPLGVIGFHWDKATARLEVECAPCRIVIAAVSEEPLELTSVRVNAHRHADRLWGEIAMGELHGTWQGTLAGGELALNGELLEAPLSELFALFGSRIPEASIARIDGRVALGATWRLPSDRLRVEPRLSIDRVEGLGTEVLRHGMPAGRCGHAEFDALTENSGLAVTAAPNTSRDGARMLRAAVIAAEDQNFYKHGGYDTGAIGAWLAVNSDRRAIVGGASTISQQLAKLLYVGGERTHIRKLRELLYAAEMERTLGKARVLELYLMIAPWGPGVCGASAAAHYYFHKSVDELTVVEAAWMAGLLRNPARVDPSVAVQSKRTYWIVDQMITIPRARRDAALEELGRVDGRTS